MSKKILLKDMMYILSRDSDVYYKGRYICNLNSGDVIDFLECEVYHIESEDDIVCVYLRG